MSSDSAQVAVDRGGFFVKQETTTLKTTLNLLRESQSTEAQTQRQVQKKLEEWSKLPEFNYSLMCVLCDPTSCDETTRSLSCLVLKNNVRKHYQNFPNELKDFIKKRSLELLRDPSSVIRATVGILITSVASSGELFAWNELLPTLGQYLNSNEIEIVESAFSALHRICEDLAEMLCVDDMSETLDAMLPRFIEFFNHPNAKIRNHALICVNQFVPIQAKPIMNMIDKYVEALFLLANDQDTEVKKNVCRSLVALFETRPDTLVAHLHSVIQYMLARSKDEDDEIALEASEFWLSVPENEYGKSVLTQYLPQLIPFFMEKMRYSADDIDSMRAEIEDDFMIPDKDDDIKPRFHRSKLHGNGNGSRPAGTESGDNDAVQDISDLDENDLEDDDLDTDDDDDTMGTSWNIRKCTAAALDCLSHSYADDILPFVFQELQKSLNHEDWIVKEAAILAIGAVAEGSLHGMIPHLPSLVPYLVERLSDAHPLVRSITCWTISRYTYWIIQNPQERNFGLVMSGLLKCILDNNKRVQEAACSAFATLAEGACIELLPYLDQILSTLVQAFDKYQHKNLLNLYDAVGTLAESVKQHLNQQKYIDILMPPIIKKWNMLNDNDRDLFPLLECLSSIAVALCEGFRPHAEAVYRRCLSLVEQNLQQAAAFNLDQENTEMPNKDFMIAALDLLSGLAEGLKEAITDLVATSNIIDLTLQCMVDSLAEVRQSSFALLGDLTKACFSLVRPRIPEIMTPLALNLQYEHVSVCNNATWAIGEIAVHLGADIRQYVPLFFGQLLNNINQPNIPRTLLDNTAISIGRLAYACPDDLAPVLNQFIKPWCSSVRSIRDNEAKDSAFKGICELIRKNPHGIVNEFYFFCDAVACWDEPKQDLKQLFYEILHGFKNQVGEQSWQQFTQSFSVEMRRKLSEQYNV